MTRSMEALLNSIKIRLSEALCLATAFREGLVINLKF
jgi:hypothetical protein